MKTSTKYFGDIEYTDNDILHIPEGLFGFEDRKEYLLIHFESNDNALLCMQCLDDPSLAFIVANPFFIKPDYAPVVSEEYMASLGLTDDSDVSFYVLCSVRDALEESTVNLRSPLVINPITRSARQVILEDTSLSFRHPLKSVSQEKEVSIC